MGKKIKIVGSVLGVTSHLHVKGEKGVFSPYARKVGMDGRDRGHFCSISLHSLVSMRRNSDFSALLFRTIAWAVGCAVCCAQRLSCVPLFVTPWTAVHQALSMGILQARMMEWVAMPSSRRSSRPRTEARSPALKAGSLPSEPPGKPKNIAHC